MKNKLTVILSSILLVLILFASCGRSKKAMKVDEDVIIPVKVASVVNSPIERKIDFLGNIRAFQELKVYSTIPTRLIEMRFDIGDTVKAGEVIAVVEHDKIKQSVLQAEAGLESAKAQYKNIQAEWKRIQKLFDDEAVSKSQYDGVKAQRDAIGSQVKQLEAGLATVKDQLNDSYITSPISGIVSGRNYEVGDQTAPQFPIFTIVKMDRLKIDIEVVEKQIDLIRTGQMTHIYVSAYPDKDFDGYVSKISPTLNPMTRTIKTEIVVENPDYKLKPGMFAEVEVVVENHENVLIIPKYSIIERTTLEYLGGELSNNRVIVNKYVFVVNDSLSEFRKIETGIEDDRIVEVVSGLNKDETIVVMGQFNLTDSTKVEIIE